MAVGIGCCSARCQPAETLEAQGAEKVPVREVPERSLTIWGGRKAVASITAIPIRGFMQQFSL
jgi:hypothetical protein